MMYPAMANENHRHLISDCMDDLELTVIQDYRTLYLCDDISIMYFFIIDSDQSIHGHLFKLKQH